MTECPRVARCGGKPLKSDLITLNTDTCTPPGRRVEAWKRPKLERKKAVWRKWTRKEEGNMGEESYCWLITSEINIASTEQQNATSKKYFFRELKPGVTD